MDFEQAVQGTTLLQLLLFEERYHHHFSAVLHFFDLSFHGDQDQRSNFAIVNRYIVCKGAFSIDKASHPHVHVFDELIPPFKRALLDLEHRTLSQAEQTIVYHYLLVQKVVISRFQLFILPDIHVPITHEVDAVLEAHGIYL